MSRRGENVYRRKDGLWEARYVKGVDQNGKKIRGSVYARTYKEAKEKQQYMVSSTPWNVSQTPWQKRTLSQVMEEWLAINETRLKPSSYQKYYSAYKNNIKDTLGNREITSLTTADLSEFGAIFLRMGRSPSTVNSMLVLIHSCMKYASRQCGFRVPEIVYIKPQRKEMRVLSVSEQCMLTEYLLQETDIYKFGVLLALYTGLRIGELCGLEWRDISDDRITVRRTVQRIKSTGENKTELHIGEPKTKNSARAIPIPSFLKEIVKNFRGNNKETEFVFSFANGKMIEPRVIQYQFKKMMGKLNIPDATFHTLRHTFATRGVEVGMEVKSLSEMLGHSSTSVTYSRYIHSSFELKQTNIEKLSTVWKSSK